MGHHAHHDMDDVLRVGIGGPVGSGKTALIEALVPILIARGHSPGVITNDIYTQEDAEHVAPHARRRAGPGARRRAWRPAPARTPRCATTRR